MATWNKARDEMGWQHWIETGVADYVIKVEKSPGGDYFVTALDPDDSAGGDIEYLPDLRQAKRFAEALLESGTWVEYTMEPLKALKAAEAAQ